MKPIFTVLLIACASQLANPVLAENAASGSQVVACVNSENGFGNKLLIKDWDVNFAQSSPILEDGFHFMRGSLGWHLTWGVLLDLKSTPIIAYETYGADGDMTGAFGRQIVPVKVRAALETCGIVWGGLWPQKWPQKRGDDMIVPPKDTLLPPATAHRNAHSDEGQE